MLKYQNFDLRIRRQTPGSPGRYVVQTEDGDEHKFLYPFTKDGEENIALKTVRVPRVTRGAQATPREEAERVGTTLYGCLLSGHVERLWARSRAVAERQNRGLRLRIRCGDAPELYRVPWEYLWDTTRREHLATSERTPIVRCLEAESSFEPRLALKAPLRILVVISQPRDLPELGSVTEIENLRNGHFTVVPLRGAATLRKVFEAVAKAEASRQPFHILHFIGHGQFNAETERGELLFEDEERSAVPCSASELGMFFRNHRTLRLAVLNACESGRSSPSKKFDGFVQGLVQQGIPAAIGMQYEIPDNIAIDFAGSFYKSLGGGNSMEEALAEARRGIYALSSMGWAIPVVYAHKDCDRLFSFPKPKVVLPDIPKGDTTADATGRMRLVRPNEEVLSNAIAASAAAIIISAPGGFGRTTQLRFLADKAAQTGKKLIWIDFLEIAEDAFSVSEKFFKDFARCFAKRLTGEDVHARVRIDQLWADKVDDNDVRKCSDFIQETLVASGSPKVCLLLDNVDRLLGADFQVHFFRLFKIWEVERHDPSFAWSKMFIVLATSEEPYVFNLKGFQEAHLPPFDDDQTATLNAHYGANLNRTQVRALRALLGGHPELTHLCLSHTRPHGNARGSFYSSREEPLVSKLEYLMRCLKEHEKKKKLPLKDSLREIATSNSCTDDSAFYQLRVLGIVGRSRGFVAFTCPLYRDFFKD